MPSKVVVLLILLTEFDVVYCDVFDLFVSVVDSFC